MTAKESAEIEMPMDPAKCRPCRNGHIGFNIVMRAFGGGWGLSGRLSKIEAGMTAMQGEIAKLVDVLKEVRERLILVGEQRQIDTDRRFTALEADLPRAA